MDVAAVTAAENSALDGDNSPLDGDNAPLDSDSNPAALAFTRRMATRVDDDSAFAAPDTPAVRVGAATPRRLGERRHYARFWCVAIRGPFSGVGNVGAIVGVAAQGSRQ